MQESDHIPGHEMFRGIHGYKVRIIPPHPQSKMFRGFDVIPSDRPIEYFEDIDIRELDWVEGYLPVSPEELAKHKDFFFSNVKSFSNFTFSS